MRRNGNNLRLTGEILLISAFKIDILPE